MAIKKSITFEGDTYFLGTEERLSAAVGVNAVPVIFSVPLIETSGSGIGSTLNRHIDGNSGSIFSADRTYEIQSIQVTLNQTASAAASVAFEVADAGTKPGAGTRILRRTAGDTSGSIDLVTDGAGGLNKPTSSAGEITLGGTNFGSTATITSGQSLNILHSHTDGRNAGGNVTVVLRTVTGHEIG